MSIAADEDTVAAGFADRQRELEERTLSPGGALLSRTTRTRGDDWRCAPRFSATATGSCTARRSDG